MSTTIPYSHPSLQVGSVVEPKLLDLFKQLNDLQQQIDTAHDALNSLVMTKRSLEMTVNELSDMQVDTAPIVSELKTLNGKITEAAIDYMHKRIANEVQIQEKQAEMQQTEVSALTELIIDFSTSVYEARPFAADSLNLDSQYFSFGANIQDDMIANIEKFVRNSTQQTPNIGDKTAKAVSSQLMNQIENHNISGTLIIVASCRHHNIGVFDPLVIDPEKAAQAWNSLHPKNPISLVSPFSIPEAREDKDSLSVITGATYGSSFVGMVHILKSEKTQMGDYGKMKGKINQKLKFGGWLANATGNFGIDESVLKELQAIISDNSINCHVSIITIGAIPSLKADSKLPALNDGGKFERKVIEWGGGEISTPESEEQMSRTRALMINIEKARIAQIMDKAHVFDEKSNSTLNINSLMTAFSNYIEAISQVNTIIGTPVSFFIKKLSKNDIIHLLIKKFKQDMKIEKKEEDEKKGEKK